MKAVGQAQPELNADIATRPLMPPIQRPKKSLCTTNRPQISGPFNTFHFLPEESLSDVGGWGGGGVGRGWPEP